MSRMRNMAALFLAAGMALSVTACSSSPGNSSGSAGGSSTSGSGSSSVSASSGELVELEYWYEGAGPERSVLYEDLATAFNEEHAGEIQVIPSYVDMNQGSQKLDVAWAGGAMPDVVYIQSTWMSGQFIQEMYLDLDPYFEAWDEHEQFDPACVEAIRNKDLQRRLFALPMSSNYDGIWWRKDLFAEAGLEAPNTWDNFFTACEVLTNPETGMYGHTLRGGDGSMKQLINEIIAYVGLPDFFDENGTAVILRDPAAAEFVTRFSDLYKNGYCPESSLTADFKTMVADFNAEVAATLIHNLGSYENQRETFTPDQYGYEPFPVSVRGVLATYVPDCNGVGIVSTCEHPDEAWTFLQYHTSEEFISSRNELVGEIPTRIDSAAHDWVKEAPHMSELPEWTAAEKLAVERPTYLPDYNSIMNTLMAPVFQEVLTGVTTPEDFLDQWATLMEEAYAEYQQMAQSAA